MTVVPQTESNKRAHTRYTLKLPATLTRALPSQQRVEIYDFCIGGMYLVTDHMGTHSTPMSHHEVIDINFILPDNPSHSHHLQARVIRVTNNSLGVAFLNPNKTALQSILNYAVAQQPAATPPVTTPPGHKADDSYTEIAALLMKNMQDVIDRYLLKQEQALMSLAQHAHAHIQQGSYFSAIEQFNGPARKQFKSDFLTTLEQALADRSTRPTAQAQPTKSLEQAKDLSLVNDDELNDWIARSDIASKIESRYHQELVGIEQRLTQLLGYTISASNNPMGPESISNAYQGALKSLALNHEVYLVCCRIFRDTLSDGMGPVYQQISQRMIALGLPSEISYSIKKTTESTPQNPTNSAHEATPEKRKNDPQTEESEELYNLISTLQFLHQTTQKEHAAHHQEGHHYSPQELIETLGKLDLNQPSASQAAPTKSIQNSITLQLLQEIESRQDGKTLSPEEMRVMETTGTLYEEMYQDNQITDGVKEWLGKLELPMLDEALQNDAILYDSDHLARRFINKLTQLEYYNDQELDTLKGSLRKNIENMLQQLSQQRSMEPVLVTQLLEKVESLLHVQDNAYQHNINDALQACSDHTTLPSLQINSLSIQNPDTDEEQLKEWRRRIRRMKRGGWVLFDAGDSNAKRLCLVWISDDFTDYAFVNLKGQMQGTIKVDILALQLYSGAAVVLDNADDSAFDRAQYSMLQKLNEKLLHETTHDALTGLVNRREFEKSLKQLHPTPSDNPDILCYYDLDYFDVINNSFGYEAGDKLLIEVAKIFEKVLAERGLLARVGGNEFALLLKEFTVDEALAITKQFKDALKAYQFIYEESKSAVSFCSGVVPINLQQHEATRLLQTAEAACRLAKGKGVNQLHVIQADDHDLKKSNLVIYWASKIDDKLNSNGLMLRYQPIVPITDKTLRPHAEILLGITDQTGSLVSPEHFILAAERYRRMPEIDRWVICNVLKFFKNNPSHLERLGGIAINLSGLSVNDDNIIPFIMDQLKASQLPTSQICFEITETAGIESLSGAAEFINEIKQCGVSFSLDDFGTGMSSYAYLKNLPVDYIKIDGSFVRDIINNKSDHAMVKSVTEIGHFMDKKIIAECVESNASLEVLRQIGVDYAQGYAIQRPQLIDSLHTKIKSGH